MKTYDTKELRNVALLGHGDSGKTTLTSAMLYTSKATTRFGKIEDGTTVTDYEPDEIARRISIYTSLAYSEWRGFKVTILDCPGFGSFVFDVKGSIRVSSAVLLLICGIAGVEVMGAKGFEFAEEEKKPLAFYVNKMDRENASFERAVASIQKSFGRIATPVFLPIGSEKDFKGIVNLIEMKAYVYKNDTGQSEESDIPADIKDQAEKTHAGLIEMVAETDESLMEKYFETGNLSEEDLRSGLKNAISQRKVFPILCGSSSKNSGIDRLLDFIVDYLPSPEAEGEAKGKDPSGGAEKSLPIGENSPSSAFVFKTISDPFSGRISVFRVMTGTVTNETQFYNPRSGSTERMAGLFLLMGKEHVRVDALKPGDIGAVMKLKETLTGDSLCQKDNQIVYEPVKYPIPAISFAVAPKSRGDEEKIMSSLNKIAEEDPNLKISRDTQTKELLASGTSQLHIEVVSARIKERYGVDLVIHQPKVPYRETIKGKADVHSRHKKQTGGHGQFADIKIKMEPLSRGKGFEFVDEIFGGSVPRQYIPAVEKGLLEVMEHGILAGYPVVDMRITLYDGGYHPVDSSELAFKIAAHTGFKDAMGQARPTLIEPIMNVNVDVPEECMGDIMGDLNSRRGRIMGMEQVGGMQQIKAQVPLAEMLTYAATLKSITSGRGSYSMEFDHYDEVPSSQQQKIIELAKKVKEEEEQ